MSEASVQIFYPGLDSRNSPARAWCAGGHSVCFFVFFLHPSLPGSRREKNTIPFVISPAIWGGSQSFTSGVVKDTVAAWEASLGFRQMESYFSPLFFLLTMSFICLF